MAIAPNLDRFLDAQAEVYESALAELKDGRKYTHWMWFVFPQIQGLGSSRMARRYAIQNAAEATVYLAHSVLGARLRECSEIVLNTDNRTAVEILGCPDDLKLKSSMTLFGYVSNKPESVFARVLEKYYRGERCSLTLQHLG